MLQYTNQFILRFYTMALYLTMAGALFLSCKVQSPAVTAIVEEETDTLEVAPSEEYRSDFVIKTYQPEETRDFKLIHTKLELGIDWQNQHLNGKASLILKPFFYNQSQLVLDAKNFEIHSVTIDTETEDSVPDYRYDGRKIVLELGREVSREEEIHVNISYTAKGYDGDTAANKPEDQKGFYFVNPSGEKGGLTQQVWTQGETECNSRWFPTIDAPNQKTTQEVFITVDDKFVTLSNGKLVYSRSNPDSTRTDYWKMDIPHAPYLFMFAAGDFTVVEDKSGDLPVNYYVEAEYAPYARNIFGNTPEMIAYYEELLNVPFPWQKYSQIIVRNFVTGAMENTTASVFMEDLNMNRRELLDYNWDDIISHELFHQWFGNYVTCESWANLPLNESFATYAEYLWFFHKYGADEASYHLLEDLEAYLEESKTKNEHLVRF
ncbi:MAG: M1 family metallopeptidase [Cyclobacteriaceae bacterium]|nr:M1 family metallopeptidase [Cyclobacteriaceae bacterium]